MARITRTRGIRDAKGLREAKGLKERKGLRELMDLNEPQDVRKHGDIRQGRDVKPPGWIKEPQGLRKAKGVRSVGSLKKMKGLKQAKSVRGPVTYVQTSFSLSGDKVRAGAFVQEARTKLVAKLKGYKGAILPVWSHTVEIENGEIRMTYNNGVAHVEIYQVPVVPIPVEEEEEVALGVLTGVFAVHTSSDGNDHDGDRHWDNYVQILDGVDGEWTSYTLWDDGDPPFTPSSVDVNPPTMFWRHRDGSVISWQGPAGGLCWWNQGYRLFPEEDGGLPNPLPSDMDAYARYFWSAFGWFSGFDEDFWFQIGYFESVYWNAQKVFQSGSAIQNDPVLGAAIVTDSDDAEYLVTVTRNTRIDFDATTLFLNIAPWPADPSLFVDRNNNFDHTVWTTLATLDITGWDRTWTGQGNNDVGPFRSVQPFRFDPEGRRGVSLLWNESDEHHYRVTVEVNGSGGVAGMTGVFNAVRKQAKIQPRYQYDETIVATETIDCDAHYKSFTNTINFTYVGPRTEIKATDTVITRELESEVVIGYDFDENGSLQEFTFYQKQINNSHTAENRGMWADPSQPTLPGVPRVLDPPVDYPDMEVPDSYTVIWNSEDWEDWSYPAEKSLEWQLKVNGRVILDNKVSYMSEYVYNYWEAVFDSGYTYWPIKGPTTLDYIQIQTVTGPYSTDSGVRKFPLAIKDGHFLYSSIDMGSWSSETRTERGQDVVNPPIYAIHYIGPDRNNTTIKVARISNGQTRASVSQGNTTWHRPVDEASPGKVTWDTMSPFMRTLNTQFGYTDGLDYPNPELSHTESYTTFYHTGFHEFCMPSLYGSFTWEPGNQGHRNVWAYGFNAFPCDFAVNNDAVLLSSIRFPVVSTDGFRAVIVADGAPTVNAIPVLQSASKRPVEEFDVTAPANHTIPYPVGPYYGDVFVVSYAAEGTPITPGGPNDPAEGGGTEPPLTDENSDPLTV